MIENMDFLKNSGLNDCEIGILANSWLNMGCGKHGFYTC